MKFVFFSLLLETDQVKMQKFYGLRGTKLNIAIAIVAGADFALFGYDQVSGRCMAGAETCRLIHGIGCYGRALDPALVPHAFSSDQRQRPAGRYLEFDGIERPGHHSWRLYFGLLLWSGCDDMAWKYAWS